ncbi:TVP38/TMEM64 family protein [Methylogaea oryzae]|uniref:TVP38/TMEM64 family membrane protein n=1 Tax=Methylogaea oryzae TaxID=1295382 RepID=A0A8D4VR08_9GAMM|nr:TVP38/TMEM64 family protein [Methylogaea oryzae]BBL72216.1 hypothetical protein MoryE10_28220 [Methylogaea oryzae]
MNDAAQSIVKGMLLVALLAGPAAFFLYGGADWLSLEHLQANREQLLAYTEAHFWTLFLAWGLLYTVATALSIPAGSVLSLAAGFLFGRWLGTVLVIVASSLGAVAVFAAARYLFADSARHKLERNPAAAKILAGFGRDAVNYLLFLRLVPLFPFWLVNLVPAFTPVSLGTYAWTTVVGIVPGCFVYANLGRSLGEIDSLAGLLSAPVLLSLSLLGVLALLPALARRRGSAGLTKG